MNIARSQYGTVRYFRMGLGGQRRVFAANSAKGLQAAGGWTQAGRSRVCRRLLVMPSWRLGETETCAAQRQGQGVVVCRVFMD